MILHCQFKNQIWRQIYIILHKCYFFSPQHYLTMMGATIALPLIIAPALCVSHNSVATGEILSTLFFVSGIVTFFQCTFGVR